MAWYALQHKPAQGDRAAANLQNQDIRIFYPKVEVEIIKAGKRTQRLEPLFPGYMFINLKPTDPQWAKLRSTRGVLRVVSFANKPTPISNEVIKIILDSLEEVAKQGGIKPGQAVELDEGPFLGLNAVFEAYEGEARAIVLIQFMQSQRRVSVPISVIKF